jgi:hypothetical protein
MIKVTQIENSDPLKFHVLVGDEKGETCHQVTLAREYCEKLTRETCAPEGCIEAAFRFLLDREPKEAILTSFDVTVISRYFPEFEKELPRYIAQG